MTDFQAVDLDAVLDQFESEFDLQEKENEKQVRRIEPEPLPNNVHFSAFEPDTAAKSGPLSTFEPDPAPSNVQCPTYEPVPPKPIISQNSQFDSNTTVEVTTNLIANEALPGLLHYQDHQNLIDTVTELKVLPDINIDFDLDHSTNDESFTDLESNIVRLNTSQPDVLSGCIDTTCDSLAEHLEQWSPSDEKPEAYNPVQETSPSHQQCQVHVKKEGDSPLSTTSTQSGQNFESIYDKYSTKSPVPDSDENPVTENEPEKQLMVLSKPDELTDEEKAHIFNLVSELEGGATLAPIVFEPEEVTDEELNQFLDQHEELNQLMSNELMELNDSETETPVQRDMGARPKEIRRDTLSKESETDDDVNNLAEASVPTINEPPDVVCVSKAMPECPPPYSELDPVRVNRPTSLELGTQPENIEMPKPSTENEPNENGSNEESESHDLLNVVLGPPGSTPANPNGPNSSHIPELLQGLSEDQLILGKIQPFWVPDSEAPVCMICDQKFTLVKRRHHCRACGKVLCAPCCAEKFGLPYLENKEARVCKPCKGILERLQKAENIQSGGEGGSIPSHRPNTENQEYSSGVPHSIQVSGANANPATVTAPVSVLKRFDTTPSGESKQVMFSDGIRPGGDLTELDEDHGAPTRRSHHSHRSSTSTKRRSSRGPAGATDVARSMIPPDRLPFVSGRGQVDESELAKIFMEKEDQIVTFTLNRNLRVYVSLVLYSPINKKVWNYRSQGLTSVGQDEVVILLVQTPDEHLPPRDIFEHIQTLYETAGTGVQVGDMGHTVILSGKPFLGGPQYGGFLYFRPTFQCIDGLNLPAKPFLFAILLTKWEMPWARVFPLRLLLRLGAEARYYPAPLWSTRQRQTVFKEIGNTIMKLLSDFRNFTYSLPIIRAMVIHMEDKLTTIIIPKNSYSQIQRALQNSNDPVLALGANFSLTADSHLVAVQRDEDQPPRNPMNNSDYETQAINILNKPRKVTGASFVVLNGALKSSAGLTAKSSIVEDGIMVQVSQERMLQIRKSLNQMEDCQIDCGPVGAQKPDETVYIKWVENDLSINAGIKSMIDGSPMDGIMSIRIKGVSQDFSQGDFCIRWTELFILPTNARQEQSDLSDPPDPARIASHIAKAVCGALLPLLKKLKEEEFTPLAVRVNLDPENAGYEAGSKGSPLPVEFANSLDNHLVPVVHGQSGSRAAFELVFHVLEV